MLRVGLTGGIGSGKSTVSALLAGHGAVVIDYDRLAREVVEPGTPALAAIVERFGTGVLQPDGSLDRPALGSIVFADDAARRDLEGITHTAIFERAAAIEAGAGEDSVVVHDNPLLVEMGAYRLVDVVVVVDVPVEVQVQRIVANRDLSEADARARIAAQATREERAGVADIIVDNTGPQDELATIVGGVWDELASRGRGV